MKSYYSQDETKDIMKERGIPDIAISSDHRRVVFSIIKLTEVICI